MSDNTIITITISKDDLIHLIRDTVKDAIKPIEDRMDKLEDKMDTMQKTIEKDSYLMNNRLLSLENNTTANNSKIETCVREVNYLKENHDIGLFQKKSSAITYSVSGLAIVVGLFQAIPAWISAYSSCYSEDHSKLE